MAKAPASSANHAKRLVTIFDKDGNELEVSRLNATDLIRDGGYFWKADDVNKARPESAGSPNPKAKTQTVFGADGTPYEVDSANARDMINTGNYFWNKPDSGGTVDEDTSSEQGEPTEPEAADEDETVVEPPASEETDPAPSTDTDVDPASEALAAQAQRVTGSDDVIVYLEGFSEQALRDMAMERYGEKPHHRASKATVIEKIVELEDARTVGDDQADA